MNFLPEEYEVPQSEGRYMRLEEGENRFRILDHAIIGYELWIDNRPVRKKEKSDFSPEELDAADVNKFSGKKGLPIHFWAFPVWDYKTESVKILEVTQVTVMRGIKDYLEDDDYGKDPSKYDFIVIKDESGDKTEYRVKAKPPKPLDEGIMQLYRDLDIDLTAMYRGEDPFGSISSSVEKKSTEKVKVNEIPNNLGKNKKSK